MWCHGTAQAPGRLAEGRKAVNVQDLSIKLAGRAADVAALAHGVPIPGVAGLATEALLRDLLAVQDEQAERLRRVEADVERLLSGPWRTAQLHLREALLEGRSRDEVIRSLDRAGSSLREALSVESERTLSRAYVAVDLAVVLAMLRDPEASRMYARESLATATDMLRDANDKWTDTHLRYSLGAGVRKFAKSRMSNPGQGSIVLASLALDWYRLALAVESLSGDRAFVIAEFTRGLNDHLWAVVLTAAGDEQSLRILGHLKRRSTERLFPGSSLWPDVELPAWSPEDVPRLPDWWPAPSAGGPSAGRPDPPTP
jgi:hypothetical protein